MNDCIYSPFVGNIRAWKFKPNDFLIYDGFPLTGNISFHFSSPLKTSATFDIFVDGEHFEKKVNIKNPYQHCLVIIKADNPRVFHIRRKSSSSKIPVFLLCVDDYA